MFKALAIASAALMLGGCASFNNLHNEVSTYGPWPAERKPATYVFERLPSQAEHPAHEQLLETAARGALETAGFQAVSDPQGAEYLMQLGAKVVSNDPWVYNDPLFWRGAWAGGYGRWGGRYGGVRGFGWGPGFGYGRGYYGYDYGGFDSSFDREVAVIIRDRKTGQLLYEARANNAGPSPDIDYLLPAMFSAALKDFPTVGPNPRDVTVPIRPDSK